MFTWVQIPLSMNMINSKLCYISSLEGNYNLPYLELPQNFNYTYDKNGIFLPLLTAISCETKGSVPLFSSLLNKKSSSALLSLLAEQEQASWALLTKKQNSKAIDYKVQGIPVNCWNSKKKKTFELNAEDPCIVYNTVNGPETILQMAQHDNQYIKSLSEGILLEKYIPKQFTLCLGFTEPIFKYMKESLLNNTLYTLKGQKAITLGLLKDKKRVEIPLIKYLKIADFFKENPEINDITIIGNSKMHFIFVSNKSTLFPSYLKDFPFIKTALIIVWNNISKEQATMVLDSLNNPNGTKRLLSAVLGLLLENVVFLAKEDKLLHKKNIKDYKEYSQYYVSWWKSLFEAMAAYIKQ